MHLEIQLYVVRTGQKHVPQRYSYRERAENIAGCYSGGSVMADIQNTWMFCGI